MGLLYGMYLSGLVLALVVYYCLKVEFEPGSIKDKRVLITGASSGIGEQIAYQYARLGARMVITGSDYDLLNEVTYKCQELGATVAVSMAADMSRPQAREGVLLVVSTYLQGLDHLVLTHDRLEFAHWTGAPEDLTILDEDLTINFLSYVDMASKALPMLVASNGSIGVVSSVAGKVGIPGFVSYATTKFAIQGFFSSLRLDFIARKTPVSVTLCILGLGQAELALDRHGHAVREFGQADGRFDQADGRFDQAGSGLGQADDGGLGQADDGGLGQADDGGLGQADDGGLGQADDGGLGQADDGGLGQADDGELGQADDGGLGQADDGGHGGDAKGDNATDSTAEIALTILKSISMRLNEIHHFSVDEVMVTLRNLFPEFREKLLASLVWQ